ncbi:fungal cellulose binding domain-containing protein [Colletotrichum falcatum]|nr:fungal cellulose binding domain-containing protein [Colletotrichum falcatum]
MRLSAAFPLLAVPLVQCHYIFSQLIVNGNAVGGDYTYMRKNSNDYQPSFTSEIVNSPELRCNKGATTGTAQTYTVAAGSRVGFKLWYNEFIEHPGPGFVYMSKVSGSLNGYDGSGDWFKVYETGLCGGQPNVDTSWCTWQKDRIEFTIPNRIPPGDYLVRVEHIGLHEAHVGKAQFYMECAHLKITGNGGGTPGPLVKIPGIYKANDPGIAYNKWTNTPAQYIMPGPKVWDDNGSSSPPPSTPPSSPPPSSGGGGAPLYGQCGGTGWSGPTTCAQGTCKATNEWYSQCV